MRGDVVSAGMEGLSSRRSYTCPKRVQAGRCDPNVGRYDRRLAGWHVKVLQRTVFTPLHK